MDKFKKTGLPTETKLNVNPLVQFIQVEPHDKNIVDIMKFCGVPSHGIEQELIYHGGGSPYLVGGYQGFEVCDIDNSYIVKTIDNNGEPEFKVWNEDKFNSHFQLENHDLSETNKAIDLPLLTPKYIRDWVKSIELYHPIGVLSTLEKNASLDSIKEAYQEDVSTMRGIGEAIMGLCQH